jgi:hypothetical protein
MQWTHFKEADITDDHFFNMFPKFHPLAVPLSPPQTLHVEHIINDDN